MKFFGRSDLLLDLGALWGKSVASLVTCRGRRRIGKSTLIHKFALDSAARFIKIEGLRPEKGLKNEDELKSFADQLKLQSDDDGGVPGNWLAAFKRLADQVRDDERTVVLLDEVSWMAYYDDTFAGTLKIAWDNYFKEHDRLVLVVCGSVSTWIKENIIDNKAYFGRRSFDLVVPELPLEECVKFWQGHSEKTSLLDVLDVLSVTGGVPRYLEEVIPAQSASENLRRMAFRPNSTLRTDFAAMFEDVITRQPKFTEKVLRTLVDGPRTVSEIAAELEIGRGGHVSDALAQLCEAGMVSMDAGKNPETGAEVRDRRFRLCDNYTRFYLKCIESAAKTIDDGSFAFARLSQFKSWNAVKGLAFENLVVNHYRELLPHLHMGETLVYSAAPYYKPGKKGEKLQIDLLLQAKRMNCLVEIKRYSGAIGRDVIDKVAEKVRRLRRPADSSMRTALVYYGKLPASVAADGYFDAIVPIERLIGWWGV